MSDIVVISEVAGFLAAGAMTAGLAWRAFRNSHPRGAGFHRAAGFSPLRYNPLTRLCSPADVRYLTSRPGASKEVVAKFRASRRRIVLAYLRNLEADFSCLETALRTVALTAPVEQPDLPKFLLEQHLRFHYHLNRIRFQVYVPGFSLDPVKLKPAVDALDSLFAEMRSLQPQLAAVAAGA